MVDAAARELGMDPAELRRRNFIPPEAMPFKTGMKLTYDSGAFADNLDYALKLIDGADFADRRRGSDQAGQLRSLGISSYLEACGLAPGETATTNVAEHREARVLKGPQANGNGT